MLMLHLSYAFHRQQNKSAYISSSRNMSMQEQSDIKFIYGRRHGQRAVDFQIINPALNGIRPSKKTWHNKDLPFLYLTYFVRNNP